MAESLNQKQHYETILTQYDLHYYDKWSTKYREEFIYEPLLRDMDFAGKRVADLACGSGFNSVALLKRFPTIIPTGYDITPMACQAYRERTGFAARQCDLTKPLENVSAEFDAAIAIGGLHHCTADLHQALRNVARLLKPGGIFMMMEPNSRFFLEPLRNFWYRHDKFFDAQNERALAHAELLALANDDFVRKDIKHFGGPAFFGVLQSMILRIPLKVKPVISPPLILVERVWNLIPGVLMHGAFLARWIRR
jgi:ubiquinone/menaquinone biosynthesis C-methylase UbiE